MVMNQLFRELGKSRCPEGRGDWRVPGTESRQAGWRREGREA